MYRIVMFIVCVIAALKDKITYNKEKNNVRRRKALLAGIAQAHSVELPVAVGAAEARLALAVVHVSLVLAQRTPAPYAPQTHTQDTNMQG